VLLLQGKVTQEGGNGYDNMSLNKQILSSFVEK